MIDTNRVFESTVHVPLGGSGQRYAPRSQLQEAQYQHMLNCAGNFFLLYECTHM